jgi:hypothetical protein
MTEKYSVAVDEPKRDPVPPHDPKPDEVKMPAEKPDPGKIVTR